ncbi:hypothetical protein HOY82DRAFT_544372, partial [Tuber indicum]
TTKASSCSTRYSEVMDDLELEEESDHGESANLGDRGSNLIPERTGLTGIEQTFQDMEIVHDKFILDNNSKEENEIDDFSDVYKKDIERIILDGIEKGENDSKDEQDKKRRKAKKVLRLSHISDLTYDKLPNLMIDESNQGYIENSARLGGWIGGQYSENSSQEKGHSQAGMAHKRKGVPMQEPLTSETSLPPWNRSIEKGLSQVGKAQKRNVVPTLELLTRDRSFPCGNGLP